jgi:hypothetical protein
MTPLQRFQRVPLWLKWAARLAFLPVYLLNGVAVWLIQPSRLGFVDLLGPLALGLNRWAARLELAVGGALRPLALAWERQHPPTVPRMPARLRGRYGRWRAAPRVFVGWRGGKYGRWRRLRALTRACEEPASPRPAAEPTWW